MGEYDKVQADLDEAYTIAMRGGIRLYEADLPFGVCAPVPGDG